MSRTVDPSEIDHFSHYKNEWWNKEGAFKTLHDINPNRLEFIEQHTSIDGKNILDVGCGGGILAEALAMKGGQVVGLDAEAEAIKVATLHAEQHSLNIHYECQHLEDFVSEPFDIITCMELLEHAQDPEMVIHHCVRLLKPSGCLFLSTIHRTPLSYLTVVLGAEYLLNLLPKQTHEYKKFIKPSELAQWARSAGLEVRDLKGLSYNPLTRNAKLQNEVKTNYIMVCQ